MGTLAAVVGFAVLTPMVLVLFAVVSVTSTAIGIGAAVRGLTRTTRVAHRVPVPGKDPAHRIYLSGPVLRDVSRCARAAVRAAHSRLLALPDQEGPESLFARLWRRQSIRNHDGPLILPPASVAGGYALGFATVVLLIAMATAVHALLAGLVVLGVRTTACVLRRFEITAQALRGITTDCATCQQRLVRPAFACECGQIHHNLVPGDQGVFRRTCLCGRRLPTLLINGKRTLHACCGLCRSPLPASAQSVPAVHLPVVGGTAAGKSAFTRAALTRLNHAYTASSLHSILLGDKHLRRLVHLYDAPGEVVERTEHLEVAAFLGLAGGMVLVVDPHARIDQKTVLDRLVETLAETRGTAIPLAVVISKADALPPACHPYAGVAPDPSARSMAARQWLLDHGRIDLLNSADNHFTQVRYFVVSSQGADVPGDDPASPVLWLLGLPPK
ncbi:GTPase domain-containing protein [Lentzea sp. PSKA42]|uniref:GTPase domain-containing protein n=1 Tax=Lentzea indica TaxID=2604800 RepID=A0ABX1FN27_9PSEU|nr:GTPase domain-containing protein [Lentzea indica]NKE60347.1 GTPase domain-containing protein [Lentzea indica]